MAWKQQNSFSSLKPWLVVIAVAVLVTSILMKSSSGADVSGWHKTLADAEAAAATSGRPILAYFSADWCPPCRAFKSETLTAAGVMDRVTERFEPAYLDVDTTGTDDAARHDVRSIPTLMLIRPDGQVISRVSGFMPPDDFLQWIERASAAR